MLPLHQTCKISRKKNKEYKIWHAFLKLPLHVFRYKLNCKLD
jgi:hypothetical protein